MAGLTAVATKGLAGGDNAGVEAMCEVPHDVTHTRERARGTRTLLMGAPRDTRGNSQEVWVSAAHTGACKWPIMSSTRERARAAPKRASEAFKLSVTFA